MRAIFFCFTIGLSCLLLSCNSEKAEKIAVATPPVIMVCEHGAVKSVMAMELFNQEAKKRGVNVRAISRGIDLYEAIPAKIALSLAADGFDTKAFRPQELTSSDVAQSSRVVSIGTDLSAFQSAGGSEIVQWDDIPPASVDYKSAQAALLVHIQELLDDLENHD